MGQLELFAQRTFAEEMERITSGAVGWQDPPEIRLEKVQSDGCLVIRRPHLLDHLASPWPEAQPHDEVMLELKLAGNHVDRKAVERALLRRQARQVQRLKEQDASWLGEEPLWLVAPHLPAWLEAMRTPVRFAPGCYRIEPQARSMLRRSTPSPGPPRSPRGCAARSTCGSRRTRPGGCSIGSPICAAAPPPATRGAAQSLANLERLARALRLAVR